MTTEREMLEFAAKACEIKLHGWANGKAYIRAPYCVGEEEWNPLTNSADCAAMCAKLDINSLYAQTKPLVSCWKEGIGITPTIQHTREHDGTDAGKEAAWRYAATMVAAKIGGVK